MDKLTYCVFLGNYKVCGKFFEVALRHKIQLPVGKSNVCAIVAFEKKIGLVIPVQRNMKREGMPVLR